MFRLLLAFIFIFNITSYAFSKENNKKDYNLLNNKLTIFINSKKYDKKIFKEIEKKLNYIQIVLDPYKSNSFISKFNKLERNTEISAPDLFVDAFRLVINYNKITKGNFDPTTFSVLSRTSKVSKVKHLLNTHLYDNCISISNIHVKISNVFSKKNSCTKISFDSIIDGIVVDNIRFLLEKQKVSSFYIIFGNTFYSKNITNNPSLFDKEISDLIKNNGIDLNSINSYAFLNNFKKNRLKTFNINGNRKDFTYQDNMFVIVATNSPYNNSILANIFNLNEKINADDYSRSVYEDDIKNKEFPIFIIYKNDLEYKTFYSNKFEKYFYDYPPLTDTESVKKD